MPAEGCPMLAPGDSAGCTGCEGCGSVCDSSSRGEQALQIARPFVFGWAEGVLSAAAYSTCYLGIWVHLHCQSQKLAGYASNQQPFWPATAWLWDCGFATRDIFSRYVYGMLCRCIAHVCSAGALATTQLRPASATNSAHPTRTVCQSSQQAWFQVDGGCLAGWFQNHSGLFQPWSRTCRLNIPRGTLPAVGCAVVAPWGLCWVHTALWGAAVAGGANGQQVCMPDCRPLK